MSSPEQQQQAFDIGSKLKQRLEATRLQKESTQKKVNELNIDLQKLFYKLPKRPRESMTELEEKISALEFQRTTTSMSLSDEKALLREIEGLQRVKRQLEEYHANERDIQEKKTQLADLREALRTTSTAIDELEAALRKVKLASKLGCTASELKRLTVNVPPDKIGRVIGKQGVTIKQIESKSKVTMDVDSISGKIHLTGSEAQLNIAIAEIDKIVMAIDEDVVVSSHVYQYLANKRSQAISEFKDCHPELLQVELRDSKVQLRGPPEHVRLAKLDLEQMKLEQETRILVGKESGILVGKQGSTIQALEEKHQVTIDISETGEDVYTCTIVGPSVASAVEAVDALLQANQDFSVEILVDPIVRNTLLTDSGAPIKKLQKEVNEKVKIGMIQLTFVKDEDDKHALVVKGRRAAVELAKALVSDEIARIEASLVTINVDPLIIPKIIGKGGETIKKLKGDGAVNIDVDKTLGKVLIQSTSLEQVKRVEEEINQLLEENRLAKIELNPATAKTLYRELSRSTKREEINKLAWMGLDDDSSTIIVRGTQENVDKAAEIVRAFFEENYVEEVEIAAEDEPTLYTGGAESPIQKFQETYGAEMNVIRSRFVVVVKGQKPKVEAAVKRLRLFLHGGEGFTVARISVTEQALGVVIGKSGSKRAELEKKHEGVNLFIHRSNRITIRGPEDAVEACRVDILRLVSSVKVQQTMSLTPEEHEVLLSKPDALKRATYGIPVQVTVAEDSVKIRGFYSDVRDAQTFIKEVITGTYEAFIELEASELSCVRGACRDPSHFQRIQETSGAEIKLDLPSNSIIVCGKRSNVRKGKDLVVRFIEFLLPASFVRLKVSKPLHATVGEASALADLAASSGATITLDRDVNSIFIQSSDPEKVKKASDILKAKIKEAERFAFVISLEASDAWLIPLIIGKGGNRANTLRLDTGCHIDINKVDRTISVTGDDEANVAKAREQLENIIDESRRQCAFVELPEDLIAAFVGRGGSHIRSFSSENHVEIERMRKEPTKFKITGEEDNVEKASKAFKEWIDHWEMRQAGQTIAIEKSAIGAVLGKNGSVIDALQKEFNCKVEINREDLTLTVRGGTEEQREKAIEKISHIVGEDRERANGHGRRERGQHGNSNHQGDSHATNHDNSKPAPKSNDSMSTLDSRKDRSAEFATRPVGLTIVEKDASKPKNKKKNRNTNKGNNAQDISDEQTLQVGSSAGRSLFNLLVSETASNPEQQQHESSVSKKATAGVSLILNEEQWDSSTVSSAAIESSDPDDENGKNAGGAKPYIKSASGFTVRV